MSTSPLPTRRAGAFRVAAGYEPRGDQPAAIGELVEGLERGERSQVLLGVTGSGKTFTVAKVIEEVNRPVLVIAHNKTLAAQLYQEFKDFFPDNAVEYFVSYYDYYQPEAYVPASDTYIEKESTINDEIDRMRLSATRSLFERDDVLIVASVSCIYGLGSPEAYYGMLLHLEEGDEVDRSQVLRKLVEIQYERNDYDLKRGTFRVRGDVIEIVPGYDDMGVRISLFGDEIESIAQFDPLTGKKLWPMKRVTVFPKTHYVASRERTARAIESIRDELDWFHRKLYMEGKLLEAQRLQQRTLFDLEMLQEVGYCHGIENYSRHFTGRKAGEPPPTLMDYLSKDTVIVIDESHQTIPQVRGMYHGDRSRKETLVEYGFRMPSALDNRPLNFEEFESRVGQTIYVSATPGPYELEKTSGVVVEQIIRPTGLMDPEVDVRPVAGQVDDLLDEIRRAGRSERAGPRHDADQAHGRRSHRVLHGARGPLSLPPLGHRHPRARGDPARAASRRLRRAHRHQPAARGARSSRGVARRDSRRRQGGLSALGGVAHPDDWPGRPQRARARHPLRRPRDRLDAPRARGDSAETANPGGLQSRAWHHSREHREVDPRRHGRSGRRGLRGLPGDLRVAEARFAFGSPEEISREMPGSARR